MFVKPLSIGPVIAAAKMPIDELTSPLAWSNTR